MEYLMAVLFCVIMAATLAAASRVFSWWMARSIQKAIARVPLGASPSQADGPRLMPESLYIVRRTDSDLSCTRPDGAIEQVEWADLRRVEILTTDDGPFAPDVFWVLNGTESGCVVPQGATGEKELLDRLFKLPGFDFETSIKASSSATRRVFLCWERRAGDTSGPSF